MGCVGGRGGDVGGQLRPLRQSQLPTMTSRRLVREIGQEGVEIFQSAVVILEGVAIIRPG